MQQTLMETTATNAMRARRIASYTYHLFSSRTADDVVIFLYDDGSDVIGQVFFPADDLPLPPASETRGCVSLYFPRSRFQAVLDLVAVARKRQPRLSVRSGSGTIATTYDCRVGTSICESDCRDNIRTTALTAVGELWTYLLLNTKSVFLGSELAFPQD